MSSTVALDLNNRRLSLRAKWAYVEIVSHCSLLETDGQWFAAGKALPAYYAELINDGLLVEVEHPEYHVPAFLKWNPSKAQMDALREGARERQAKSRGMSRRDIAGSSRTEVEVEVETELTKPQPLAPRRRDELFESVADVCHIDISELTPAARGALNKAVGDLRKVGATPEDVRVRAGHYPYDDLTPNALAKHWPRLAREIPRTPRSANHVDAAYRRALGGEA